MCYDAHFCSLIADICALFVDFSSHHNVFVIASNLSSAMLQRREQALPKTQLGLVPPHFLISSYTRTFSVLFTDRPQKTLPNSVQHRMNSNYATSRITMNYENNQKLTGKNEYSLKIAFTLVF